MKKILLGVLLIVFFLHLFYRAFLYGGQYTKPYDAKYWEDRYNQSQWVNPFSTNPIGDDGLYAYEGWVYVHGSDPTLLNPEVPPLGKYILGFSILIFRNQNIFAFLTGILALFLLYVVNKQIIKNTFLSFLPVLLFSFEPIFYTQLRAPYFDMLYVSFLLLTFLFFLKKKYILAGIFLGCMTATKSSLTTLPLVLLVIGTYSALRIDKKLVRKLCIIGSVSLLVFFLTYTMFFVRGGTPKEFLGVLKYTYVFYTQGAQAVFGDVFSILFTGVWHTWWGEVVRVQEYLVTWPIIFTLTVLYVFLYIKRRKFDSQALLIVWTALYLLFLVIIPVFPRYLLLLIPFLYNFSIWVLLKSISPKHFS